MREPVAAARLALVQVAVVNADVEFATAVGRADVVVVAVVILGTAVAFAAAKAVAAVT